MKKIVSLLLALVLCFPLYACGNSNNADKNNEAHELISVEKLISDLDNLARAEQNVGKAVNLFGRITAIGKDTLTINHIFINKSFTLSMDSAILAELNKEDFIAVYAVVEEINNGQFKFKNCKQIEMETMDNYVINMVSTSTTYDLIVKHSGVIADYITSRGKTFRMTDDAEISAYILGAWNWPYGMGVQGTYISTVEYFENGECIWQSWHEYMNHWKNSYCDWSVKDGIFNGCSASDTPVYKITENAFVHAGDLYVRVIEDSADKENDTLSNPICFRSIVLSDKDTANHVLKLWRDGEATDSSMKALMDEYGADQAGGALYELYYPENYIPEIASWCLDPSRMAGDTTILETEYGYAIVYIVSLGNS